MEKLADFDRVAGPYRWMEYLSFGPMLQWCRCAHLERAAGARRALVLGDGDGRFTHRLLLQNPEVQVLAVDGSAAMLRALLRRAGRNAGRVTTENVDLRIWEPAPVATRGEYDPKHDLVASHFFLDCLTTDEVCALAGRVRKVVTPGAIWLVSEFSIPEGRFGRFVARPLVWGLYWVFSRLTGLAVRTLPDHQSALRSAGFALIERRKLLLGLLVSEAWAAC
jgi:hypothetical protein